jgi:hypothetical protein
LASKDEPHVWTARELAQIAIDNGILKYELGGSTERAVTTRMGIVAGRFVGETFRLSAGPLKGGSAVFGRRDGRNGSEYIVTR